MAHKSALRALKRRISDALYGRMIADARSAAATIEEGPGGQLGNDSVSSVAGSHPKRRLSGVATPGPGQTLDRSAQPRTSATHHAEQSQREEPLDNKEASICMRLAKRQSLCQREQMRRSASHATGRQTESPQFTPAQRLRSPVPARPWPSHPQPSEAGCSQLRRSLAQGGRDFGGG
jgi:hypothetical protein